VDFLSKGRKVRIAYGPMKGIEGVVIKKKNRNLLEISVDAIGQGLRISIKPEMLEPLSLN